VVFERLNTHLEENPREARDRREVRRSGARREAARKARDLTRRKGALDASNLPASWPTARSVTPSSRALPVEGDSAGARPSRGATGSSRPSALKGKILNVEKARFDKMLSSDEIK